MPKISVDCIPRTRPTSVATIQPYVLKIVLAIYASDGISGSPLLSPKYEDSHPKMSVLYQNQAGLAKCDKRKAVKMEPQATYLARGEYFFILRLYVLYYFIMAGSKPPMQIGDSWA